eukprot:CAMPEP_0179439780 /NCGR_PEP_ID=MMETSP0799-20121207/23402_1 /TAXON_ID=46947 /ORGANISM="Geminigera cryophila, Strain CCMP2564" /LENGTH=97 /DNA_ID=CAMNT_0021222517 /DNA_START=406 /DNA_END=700 /DNA_ORIENTATION=+
MYEGDDLNLVQDWVRQLPEMEHDLQEHVCACFRDELVDVEVLVELQAADFAYMGVTKLGWQKKLLRRSRQELACRLLLATESNSGDSGGGIQLMART